MIVYTAEDFAQANLATKGRFDVARRTDPSLAHQWHVYGGRQGYFSDEEMAADGWVPVGTKKALERAIKELRYDLKVALAAVADLGDENDRLERILQAPLSLKDLGVAWEAAEVPTDDAPIREGDVVIYTSACGTGVTVHKAAVGQFGRETHGYVRVLSRAPKREPWQDLADVFKTWDYPVRGYEEELAKWVYAKGVRGTGGDHDE